MNSEDENFENLLDDNNTGSLFSSPERKTERCASTLVRLNHTAPYFRNGSVLCKNDSKILQTPCYTLKNLNVASKSASNSESSVDYSILKYLSLNTEIGENDLLEIRKYLSKFTPKKNPFSFFFAKRKQKIDKQVKTPSFHASDLRFLDILRKKQKCNCRVPLNLQENTSKEAELNEEDCRSDSLLSNEEMKKIVQVASIPSSISSVNLQSDESIFFNIDAVQLLDVKKYQNAESESYRISSELNASKEEAKLKPSAICKPIFCSEHETDFEPSYNTNIARDVSNVVSMGQRDPIIDEVKAITLQIAAISELQSHSRYSRSDNVQPIVQITENISSEFDDDDEVQILSVIEPPRNVATVRNHDSTITSSLMTSKGINCVTFPNPVIEEVVEYLGTEPIVNNSAHSTDNDFEIMTLPQASTREISHSESGEEVQILAIKQGIVKESMHSSESTGTHSRNAFVALPKRNMKKSSPLASEEKNLSIAMAEATSETRQTRDKLREEILHSSTLPTATKLASQHFSNSLNSIPQVAQIANYYDLNDLPTRELPENQEKNILICKKQRNENKNSEPSRNFPSDDSDKGKINVSTLNDLDQDVLNSYTRINEATSTLQKNFKNSESTNEEISTPIPPTSLRSKIYDHTLTISIASNRKRIVREREANTLSIVPVPSIALNSKTQYQFSCEESPQDTPICSATSRTVISSHSSKAKMQQNGSKELTLTLQTSAVRNGQEKTNKPKESTPRTSEGIMQGRDNNSPQLGYISRTSETIMERDDNLQLDSASKTSKAMKRTSVDYAHLNCASRITENIQEEGNNYAQMGCSGKMSTNKNNNERKLEGQTNLKHVRETASRRPDNVFFDERKGKRAFLAKLSHKNVGKTFIENDDMPSLILEWNANWLLTQNQTKKCAPICDRYYHVKDCYEDEQDYYNTYFPLHLLSVWLRISESWKKNTLTFDCVFDSEVETRNAIKVTCYTALNLDRYLDWPRREDIVLCKASKPGGGTKELFGRVFNVTYTDYETSGSCYGASNMLKRVTFQFFCAEALDVPNLITLKIQILCNIRIALLQNDALQNLNCLMKDLIIDPRSHRNSMNFIPLYPRHHKAFPKCIQKIMSSILSSDIRITVVDALVPWDNIFVMSQLAMDLIKKNRPVLIGLRNSTALLELAAVLKRCNLILAVRTKDVRIPEDYRRYTLDERFGILNREVFSKCHVTLTLLSSIYMGDFSDVFAEQNLTCILPEAHLATETESTLLMYYDVKHLVLMGQSEHQSELHPILKRFGYHISLFSRLHKAK